ncbi:MAG: hypothetical protein PVG02_07265 [Anaerolineales bacterium]|jgi:hypothetical protein
MKESKYHPLAKKFSDQYTFQTRLIQQLVEGVTNEESLLQMQFEANCMNWILGHVISRRHSALEALGSKALWGESQLARYQTGSEPIHDPDQAIEFLTLCQDLERSLELLQSALLDADHAMLDRVVVNDRGKKTAADHIDGFLWHETYHIGQLEILNAFIQSTH